MSTNRDIDLHPGLLVAGDRAVELVLPGLQVGTQVDLLPGIDQRRLRLLARPPPSIARSCWILPSLATANVCEPAANSLAAFERDREFVLGDVHGLPGFRAAFGRLAALGRLAFLGRLLLGGRLSRLLPRVLDVRGRQQGDHAPDHEQQSCRPSPHGPHERWAGSPRGSARSRSARSRRPQSRLRSRSRPTCGRPVYIPSAAATEGSAEPRPRSIRAPPARAAPAG